MEAIKEKVQAERCEEDAHHSLAVTQAAKAKKREDEEIAQADKDDANDKSLTDYQRKQLKQERRRKRKRKGRKLTQEEHEKAIFKILGKEAGRRWRERREKARQKR